MTIIGIFSSRMFARVRTLNKLSYSTIFQLTRRDPLVSHKGKIFFVSLQNLISKPSRPDVQIWTSDP
eukprot:UN14638